MLTLLLLAIPQAQAPIGGSPIFRIEEVPPAPDERGEFGASVASLGDVNGDGFHDFIVGATRQQTVTLYSGRNAAPLYELAGEQPDSGFGAVLVAMPDLDGDGIQEFLVGAPWFDRWQGRFHGKVYLYSGGDGRLLRSIGGAGPEDRLGPAGHLDADGDGVADLLLHAAEEGAGHSDGRGYVVIVSGATGQLWLRHAGPGPDDNLTGAAPLGDANGDGFDDFAVARYRAGPGRTWPGRVEARSGLDGSLLWARNGTLERELFGYCIAGIEDLDRDGVGELLATRGSVRDGIPKTVLVLSGADGATLLELDGNSGDEFFGYVLGSAGDVDGDGLADPAVGAPFSEDSRRGIVWVFSGADGRVLYEVAGARVGRTLGMGVAPAGDLNGDGFGDFLAAGPGGRAWLSEETAPGAVTAFSGGPVESRAWRTVPMTAPDFGATEVEASDVDGDGDDDVLVVSRALGAIDWFENDGSPVPQWPSGALAGGLNEPFSPSIVDLNGDGAPDVLFAEPRRVSWLENPGPGGGPWPARLVRQAPRDVRDLLAADVDADGDTDIVLALAAELELGWLENDGQSPPAWTGHVIRRNAHGPTRLATGDQDGDGRLDVLVAADRSVSLAWYRQQGGFPPNWAELPVDDDQHVEEYLSIAAADIDGDGEDDVLAGVLNGPRSWPVHALAYKWKHYGCCWTGGSMFAAVAEPQRVATADFDADGDPDAAVVSTGNGRIYAVENLGLLSSADRVDFLPHLVTGRVRRPVDLATGDFTGNGLPDLVSISGEDGRVWFHQNGARAPRVDDPQPGRPGRLNEVPVRGALPASPVLLAWSPGTGQSQVAGCPAAARLDLDPARPIGTLVSDAQGVAVFSFSVPAAASGKLVYLQAADLASCTVGPLRSFRFP